MNLLEDDVRAAKAQGLSYGQYKAISYKPITRKQKPTKGRRPPKKTKRYTDEAVFSMWQSGMTDSQIGAAVGVSRQVIQNWRDNLELPSTHKIRTNTKKYRLAKWQDGTYYVLKDSSNF